MILLWFFLYGLGVLFFAYFLSIFKGWDTVRTILDPLVALFIMGFFFTDFIISFLNDEFYGMFISSIMIAFLIRITFPTEQSPKE